MLFLLIQNHVVCNCSVIGLYSQVIIVVVLVVEVVVVVAVVVIVVAIQ